MPIKIEPVKEPWPYIDPPKIIEGEIRELLKENPDLKYGAIEGKIPVIYWDRPTARFGVVPAYAPKIMVSAYQTWLHVPCAAPHPILAYKIIEDSKETCIVGSPCLIPEPRIREYATYDITKEGRIIPRTPFYGGTLSIHLLIDEILEGTAEPLASINLCACFYSEITEVGRAAYEHLEATSKMPRAHINTGLGGFGYCVRTFLSDFIKDATNMVKPLYQVNLEEYTKKFTFYLLTKEHIDTYYPYISLKDIMDSGQNRLYPQLIRAVIISLLKKVTKDSVEDFYRRCLPPPGVDVEEVRRALFCIRQLLTRLKIDFDEGDVKLILFRAPTIAYHPLATVTMDRIFSGSLGSRMLHRIDYELYDKPVHLLEDLYLNQDDLLAYFLSEAIKEYLYEWMLDAAEVIKEKFGYKIAR